MNEFFTKGQTVLFQGDSITDAGRTANNPDGLGEGYPCKIAEIYNQLFPHNPVSFVNRGVSGNRCIDIINRYDSDVKNVKPDFISILIGINEVWRKYDENMPTSVDEFIANYTLLLENIKCDFPYAKIMIIEPFLLPSDADKLCFADDLYPQIFALRNLARKYANYYLSLDGIFAEYTAKGYTPAEISADGVHPSPLGHSIIAYEFLKALNII